ncbi:MAG: hypothetical protein PVJ09_03830 [Candidatus Woesebacteria bacterium]|jgi:hypothetical protein
MTVENPLSSLLFKEKQKNILIFLLVYLILVGPIIGCSSTTEAAAVETKLTRWTVLTPQPPDIIPTYNNPYADLISLEPWIENGGPVLLEYQGKKYPILSLNLEAATAVNGWQDVIHIFDIGQNNCFADALIRIGCLNEVLTEGHWLNPDSVDYILRRYFTEVATIDTSKITPEMAEATFNFYQTEKGGFYFASTDPGLAAPVNELIVQLIELGDKYGPTLVTYNVQTEAAVYPLYHMSYVPGNLAEETYNDYAFYEKILMDPILINVLKHCLENEIEGKRANLSITVWKPNY